MAGWSPEDDGKRHSHERASNGLPEDTESEFRRGPEREDPVERALAKASSVGRGSADSYSDGRGQDSELQDSTSLMQVIDQVERRLRPNPESHQPVEEDIPEELDALDIEADLGRPDESPSSSYPPPMTEDGGEQPELTMEAEEESGSPPSRGEPDVDTSPPPPPPPPVSAVFEDMLRGEDPENEDSSVVQGAEQISLQSEPGDREREEKDVDSTEPITQASEGVSSPRSETGQPGLRFAGGFQVEGELEETPVWTLLLAMHVDQLSGALAVGAHGVERRFFFEGGDVLMATSTAREDRLVELLYREGRLGEEEYSEAVLTIGASGRRVGAVLVEKGLISSRELFPLVRHHYEAIVLDSFSWREGTWRFEPEAGTGAERILLEASLPAMLLEGIRSRAPQADISKLVPSGSHLLETPSGVCAIEKVGLLPEEVAIVHACDGTTTVGSLARRFGHPRQELRGLFAGLAVLGLVAIEGDMNDRVSEVPGVPVAARRVSEQSFRMERSRVADKMAQIEEASYFAILEVSPKASGYEIKKAFRSLMAQYSMKRYAVPELLDLNEQILLIRSVTEEAYQVLRNPALRDAYRQSLKDELYIQ